MGGFGRLDYQAIDADTHFYEVDDCFSRWIDPEFRDRAIRPVATEVSGRTQWALGDVPLRATPHNLADSVPAPGSLEDLFSGNAEYSFELEAVRPRDMPSLMHREPRLVTMDEQGIQAQIMLPTVGLAVEQDFDTDLPALLANYRSFNKWLEEDWGYGVDGRIYGVPMLTLMDLDWAVEETVRLAALGSRMVYVKTGPVLGLDGRYRSPADPYYDRFWATIEETGMVVVFHIDFGPFNDIYAIHWSEDPKRSIEKWSPLQLMFSNGARPIADTMAALLVHNLFGRFPKVQVMTLELGSAWVRPMLQAVDKAVKFATQGGSWLGGRLDDLPSAILPNHLTVAPYYEDDIRDAVDLLGIDRVVFGSDYPHPEGLGEPLSYLKYLTDFTPDETRKIIHDNTAQILGLPTLTNS